MILASHINNISITRPGNELKIAIYVIQQERLLKLKSHMSVDFLLSQESRRKR
jgi:hypothetical protein